MYYYTLNLDVGSESNDIRMWISENQKALQMDYLMFNKS